jgi:hypothetical protein
MIFSCMCSLTASPGSGIVHLLESLGLHGFPLFLAALAISALILGVSYLIATSGLNSKKKS